LYFLNQMAILTQESADGQWGLVCNQGAQSPTQGLTTGAVSVSVHRKVGGAIAKIDLIRGIYYTLVIPFLLSYLKGAMMTDAELAILSLLVEKPRTDQSLHAEIEERGLRRWTAIGVSSMYYVLEKLEKQGLVQPIPDETPNRMWKITTAGYAVLQTAVADLLSTPHSHARGFELGLANLHVLKPSQVRAALANYRQDLVGRATRADQELKKELAGSAAFQTTALYSHNVAMYQAELKWIDRFMAEYESRGFQDPPEVRVESKPIPRIQQVVLPDDPDSVHKHTTLQSQNRKPNTKSKPSSPTTPLSTPKPPKPQ
jgi:DNA-binding PadR family transcriptional regulator